MDKSWFLGCPYYKSDIVDILKSWYPDTPVTKFNRMKINQLRRIYAETRKKAHEKSHHNVSSEKMIFWPAELKKVLAKNNKEQMQY